MDDTFVGKRIEPAEPAETGQVWEGSDGWVILITEAGRRTPHDEYIIHAIQTLSYPSRYNGGPITTVTENHSRGGMAHVGWKRIT